MATHLRSQRYTLTMETPMPNNVVLYDGDCAVCDTFVQFLLDRDEAGMFHYASLQSDFGQAALARHTQLPKNLDSIVYLEQGSSGESASIYSDAILNIVSKLPGLWSWTKILKIVPGFVRNPFYKAFAAVRYRIFGKVETCRLPRPGEAERFLS